MTANQLYPAHPVGLVDDCQFAGLGAGEYYCQPLWRGRRAIMTPDGVFWSPRGGKPYRWKLGDTVRFRYERGLVLDLTRPGGGRLRINDVVIARPLSERIALAATVGLHLDAVCVSSADEVNAELLRWSAKAGCVGVVLKHRNTVYPWLPHGPRKLAEWLMVTRPIARVQAK